MLYAEDLQTVAAGGTLNFTNSDISSPTAAISAAANGLLLAPGRYLVSFVSDASVPAAGTIGAALALNGAPLAYGESAIVSATADAERLALTAIVTLSASGTLSVINSTANSASYENSTLTVVRLT